MCLTSLFAIFHTDIGIGLFPIILFVNWLCSGISLLESNGSVETTDGFVFRKYRAEYSKYYKHS